MQRCWMCDHFRTFRKNDQVTKGYCIKDKPLIKIVNFGSKCNNFLFFMSNQE